MKHLALEALQKSRQYTLAVADAVPDGQYDFKPTEAVWSFKELMNHIAYSMIWMEENYLTKGRASGIPRDDRR